MSLVPPPPTADYEPYVNDEAVAQRFGVTRMTVYRWTKYQGLPSHKLGGLRRYKMSEVEAWAMSRCTSPAPDQRAAG